MRLLFVCTGNICRSPTAEAILRGQAQQRGLDARLTIDSAGTHGYHVGEPPDERACAAAAERGYDMSALRARRVAAEDFQAFDHVVAMAGGHLDQLRRWRPRDATAEVQLFTAMARLDGAADVPDPYYGDWRLFEHALDRIEVGCGCILDRLEAGEL